MIRNGPYPSLPWHGQGSRQKVVRSRAQHARYFLLGLAVVSLFIGLNVFLASQTDEIRVRISGVERECQELEWLNAERVAEIALATNIDAADDFAAAQGFSDAQKFVHLGPGSPLSSVSTQDPQAEQSQGFTLPETSDQRVAQTVLAWFRGSVSAPRADQSVATIR